MFYQIIHTGKDTKKRWNAQAVRPRFLRCGFGDHRRLRPAYARTLSWHDACGSIPPRLWHKGEGVLGGIANYFDVDPTIVRIIYSVLTVCTAFSGIILYPILWLIIPKETE